MRTRIKFALASFFLWVWPNLVSAQSMLVDTTASPHLVVPLSLGKSLEFYPEAAEALPVTKLTKHLVGTIEVEVNGTRTVVDTLASRLISQRDIKLINKYPGLLNPAKLSDDDYQQVKIRYFLDTVNPFSAAVRLYARWGKDSDKISGLEAGLIGSGPTWFEWRCDVACTKKRDEIGEQMSGGCAASASIRVSW